MKHLITLLIAIVPFFFLHAQTIQEIQGTGAETPYLDQVVSTSGIVTAKGAQGYFIQDGIEPRSGIYVYDDTQSPVVGDEITLTAKAVEYFTLTELTTVTAFEVLSSGNDLPEPIVLTTGAANNEDYEGMLITVQVANCTNTDLGFGEWQLDDGSGPISINDLFFPYSPMANTDYSVTGPQTYSFDFYKIEPRSAEDIVIEIPLYFTVSPIETDITTTSISIDWETNVAASTEYSYGLTPALELGSVDLGETEIDHSIEIQNLEPATVYYVKAISKLGDDEAPGQIRVVCTESNSSGKVNVYFNHSVDHSVATNELAVSTEHIIDTIISYINLANTTLDVTMYETENQEIVDAINAAYDRGVDVRVISDDEGTNAVFDNLNQSIAYLEGNPNGIMHDKFMIVDRDDVDNAWLLTGSMNHTVNNLGWDYNNVICVQDQSLARGYTLEFDEMWGGTGLQPDLANSKFGADKTDNTPHRYIIGGIPAELFFSPSDGTASQIQRIIDNAEDDFAFAVLVFTENSLGTATRNAHDRGVNVKGIIDYVEFNGSEFNFLMSNGVNVMDYQNADGSQWPDGPTLHHKYAIVDYKSEDATLITGSHNWSASANSIHDENTLIFYDATLANIYYQEFNARFADLTPTNNISIRPLTIAPNPTTGLLGLNLPEKGALNIRNMAGQLVWHQTLGEGQQYIDVADLTPGIYMLNFKGSVAKLIIAK